MDEKEEESLHKKIEELEREKQQIISLVSHDIKAPLNRIFALVQLLQMDGENLNDDQRNFLDKMHLVVADGLGLIRNLVDYRNLEYRKSELLIEKVNLHQLIQLVIKNFQTVATKKLLTIETELQPEIFIQSDHHSIIRIIESLLGNAIKFSSERKAIRIRSGVRDNAVFFSVQDEGPGFTADDLTKMYRKFQKLTARPTGGESVTGLGLFLVKTMADRIGAEVVCVTEEGLGSTFTVTIPR
jgi:two-component system sensor histidine kinase/response regulator